MKHRVLPFVLACWTALAVPLTQAQGLRPSAGNGVPRLSSPATLLPPAGSAAPSQAGPRQADYIVAVVNSEPITNNEVRQRADRLAQQVASQGGSLPARDLLLKDVLERLILEKIQVQLAKESGIKVDDYAVTQAEQSVARQNQLSLQEMHRRMEAEGISQARFREELRSQLLALRVRERDVESRVRVSDLEVDQYLRDQQKSAAVDKLELNLAHILIQVPENASPAQASERSARAQEVLAKLQAGGDFGALAREYSDAPEGTSGGLLGLRPADRYPELFVNAVQNANVGSVVGPLRSPAGFHLLKVIDKTHGGVATTAIQNHARHILLRTNAGLTEREAAARLEDLRDRVVRGQAEFAALAREYSQDGSAKDGGDLGWASPGRYVPEFEEVLDALAPGEISHPVVSRFGVHLIQLMGRREAKLTQREQRDMVRDTVREKKLDEAYSTWIQEARGRAYVEYREPPQ
ncbi:peptidylprolyl isomerase [Acidovorax sp. MR-S7]|uniref:peptidylprolyl isomerase n=1 Tax=Acidovorax sp. MR-S7 TaxID=1268622 RepID=UPI00038144BB|nr:peptidylprolyl isomerase [Acidovorax sp. MR-S7]GAD21180.1 parvulin-like peptidyl-prolyl isomerase [Acidovorax sp. MR-S7]